MPKEGLGKIIDYSSLNGFDINAFSVMSIVKYQRKIFEF